MFSGIIRSKAEVKDTKVNKGILTVSISSDFKARLGESIAVNGVCSTLAQKKGGLLYFDYMPETLRVTTIGELKAKDIVNLESSLRRGDPIDGHFVLGHVDAVGMVKGVSQVGKSKVLSLTVPKELRKYIAYKGSITIDGVALTISKVTTSGCEVSLIPYTLKHTNLDKRRVGDKVNIECDIIAKYLNAKKRK